MNGRKILIRFDDICPSMDWKMWKKAEEVLEKYNIKPLLGVVPLCRDTELNVDNEREDFWEYIVKLKEKGYVIAMHGCYHVYDKKHKSLVSNTMITEFAGHSYDVQLKKIEIGKKYLLNRGIETDVFFAPSHSYDLNTLRALHKCGFKYISDGKTLKLIEREGIICVPCRNGGIPKIKDNGLYTVVLHTGMWSREEGKYQYKLFKTICQNYNNDIIDFYEFVDCYSYGNRYIQNMIERLKVLFDRDLRPRLSIIKRKIMSK